MRRRRHSLLAAALAVVAAAPACKRASSSAAAAKATEPGASASAAPAPMPSALPSATDTADAAQVGEAQRGVLHGVAQDPVLSSHAALITQHFGAASELAFQSAPLADGRQLVLLQAPAGSAGPLLLDIDAAKSLVWHKTRPLAGIGARSDRMAISGGPHGNVVFFFYDPPTRLVGMRVWDSEGGILMDAEVLQTANCDALSALYWPGRGFVVAAASLDSVKVELVGEEGRNRWGNREMALARWRTPAPVSMIPDRDDSVLLFQVGYLAATPGRETPDHLFAMRYDVAGLPLWPGPLDAGRLPGRVAADAARARLTRAVAGTVRAELPGLRFSVDVSSMGKATRE